MTEVIDDGYFTNIGMRYIRKTVDIFERFEVAHDAEDWKWMKVDGSVFGEDTDMFNFYIHHSSDGFSVQLCSKEDTSNMCYMFGIYFSQDGLKKKARVYHHPHGPFTKLYGMEYEKSPQN